MMILYYCHLVSATRISLFIITAACMTVHSINAGIHHTDVYPPHDDYTFTNFNPENLYGSPYGGFARATESRLAKMSLQLSDTYGFEFLQHQGESDETVDVDASDGKKSRNKNVAAAAVIVDSQDAPHFSMRDGDGRLFACRVYKEEELAPESVHSSMFDDAILISEQTNNANAAEGFGKPIHPDTTKRNKKSPFFDIDNEVSLVKLLETRVLSKLSFKCLQLHLGWWSYEWCDMSSLKQYHIEEERTGEVGSKLKITDRNNLGTFKNKAVFAKGYSPHVPTTNIMMESVIIVHEFDGGDYCEEKDTSRKTNVEVHCCTPEFLRGIQQAEQKSLVVESQNVYFMSISEESVCTYTATACSPLICRDNLMIEMELMSERMEKYKEEEEDDLTSTASSDMEGDEDDDLTLTEEEEEANQYEFPTQTGSIRDILKNTLKNKCLSKNAGWWHYEFCHMKHVREFHPKLKYAGQDPGIHVFEEEDEHSLGKYDESVHESYKDEEEIDHLETSYGAPHESNNVVQDSFMFAGVGGDSASGSDSNNIGNGAVFVQEYTHGDVCEDSDVTEVAIKGGDVVDGGIERSSTLRFSCGKRHELVRVNEDSTCHYVIDITLPELCLHPLFKAEVVSGQVVKCLPVMHEVS